MQAPQARLVFEFGDFELDPMQRTLHSRPDGRRVEITERVLEALVYLAERPGQLVEKKALIAALWPHVVVEEGNLTQTIYTLRRALGDRPDDPRYIATVPGRGYRFIADVKVRAAETQSVDSAPARRPKRALWAAALVPLVLLAVAVAALRSPGRPTATPALAAVPAAVPAQRSIAVLPFVDMSSEQDQVQFAEGLSEEILNQLAHTDKLRVIARTSSFSFKGQHADIATIANRLSVSHVLEGSVRRSGERLRITAQLIDGATSAHVWSETYDRDPKDILGVQREIASAVAHALHVTLARSGPRPAETTNAEAYAQYLQGRYLFHRRAVGDLEAAKVHFEKAVQLDPNYGRAWAALAGDYFVSRYEHIAFPNATEHWREAAERGVALAPDIVEAQVRAGQYFNHTGDVEQAQKHFARAAAIDPEDSMVIGFALSDAIIQGRLQDAIAAVRRMVAIDPLSATQRGNLGCLLVAAGQLGEAQTELQRALELSPDGNDVLVGLADVFIRQGRPDEALKFISRITPDYLRDQRLALAHFAGNDASEANALLLQLIAQARKPNFERDVAVAIAEVYAFRRDPDNAFKWLEIARPKSLKVAGDSPGWLMLESLQVSPYLVTLHEDARWSNLVAYLARCD